MCVCTHDVVCFQAVFFLTCSPLSRPSSSSPVTNSKKNQLEADLLERQRQPRQGQGLRLQGPPDLDRGHLVRLRELPPLPLRRRRTPRLQARRRPSRASSADHGGGGRRYHGRRGRRSCYRDGGGQKEGRASGGRRRRRFREDGAGQAAAAQAHVLRVPPALI